MTLPAIHIERSTSGHPMSVTGRFRKRPTEVVATRWWANGDHPDDGVGNETLDPVSGRTCQRVEGAVVRFYRNPDTAADSSCSHCGYTMHDHGWIDTLEGGFIVCPGDWIVTGIKNERYPVKPDIFTLTYEPVSG